MIKNGIQTFKNCKKTYRNYFSVMLQLLLNFKKSYKEDNIPIKVVLKDGQELKVPYGWVTRFAEVNTYKNKNISNISLTKDGISFHYKNHFVIIDPARFSDFRAVFFREEYSFLQVKDHDVIDIGMNMGDSAIYFALNGAKRVIGLEPYPYVFSYAEKNIKLNKLNNVILLNAGYGKDAKILVDDKKISSIGSSLISSNSGKEIPIYSLKTLFQMYKINNAIVKMDCEGWEYALLEEDDETLKNIDMMQIEYHYGYSELVEKLKKAGFYVEYTDPIYYYDKDKEAENPKMLLGYIYAKRI
ncbi:MAG: FkbM family methyltransferase [Candidatus Nanopusillus acidilobi]